MLLTITGSALAASSDSWTNTESGAWSIDANWSSNRAPSTTFSLIVITNSNSKTVTIDSACPTANRSVQKLTLSAPPGFTNTLRVVDVITNDPFMLSGTFLVDRQCVLELTNSALVVNGASGAILNVASGTVSAQDSSLDCSTTTSFKLGSTSGSVARMCLRNGSLNVFQMQIAPASGSQGTLELSNAAVNAGSMISMADGANSTALLTLQGGFIEATNDLTRVGSLGNGQLELRDGRARFAFLSIGDNWGSTGTVSVAGGQLDLLPRTDADCLRVGNYGNGQLNISGGTNFIAGEIHVADVLDCSGTIAVTGGQLVATNAIVSVGRYGVGLMTLSDGLTVLTNTSVGRHDGAVGTLLVQSNAVLQMIGDLSIGRFSNAVGHVEFFGGLVSMPSDSIWVGREGTGDFTNSGARVEARTMYVGMSDDGTNVPSGTVFLSGGATLLSSSLIVGSDLLSTGQVIVAGGVLAITNNSNIGTLNVQNGGFVVSGATVQADTLVLTNPAGQFLFSSGRLGLQSAVVSNGLPFVVGDGVSPATLELLGGTYSFVDGLVVSSNATVTGCGTILGAISNLGTIQTNCSPGVRITGIHKTDASTEVIFTTVAGATHLLQYSDSLSSPANWNTVLPGIVGNGGVMTNFDTSATNLTRFYRIQVQ